MNIAPLGSGLQQLLFSPLVISPSCRTGMGLKSLVGVWALVVASGMTWINRYGTTPGVTGDTPVMWPEEIPWVDQEQRAGLLMFAHPRCPCTRASLNELQRITDRAGIQADVIFWQPKNTQDETDWSDTSLIRQAKSLSNLRVHLDHGGRMTDRFDARTSGLCLVFEEYHGLLFRGGVTSSRGHEGVSDSHSLILKALANPSSPLFVGSESEGSRIDEFPVFGCEIDPKP
ncbi:MAG: hypothetical protein AAF664_14485 [Planctomycetota bacterium]